MGIWDFIKTAGEKLFGAAKADEPDSGALVDSLKKLGLPTDGLNISVDGDTVKVSGTTPSQEMKEKIVLALGNVMGVAKVEESIETPSGDQSTFYTVKSGDTLSAISKHHYGDANKYMKIFEANKPMLTHPDKIYPGQVLRIPAAG